MRRLSKVEAAGWCLLAYLPFLLSDRGQVYADSKPALFTDPGRFLARAVSSWDPSSGLGGVPHQSVGYLTVVGPFFWVTEQLGLPVWVAQRLWLGTISLVAVLGARWLFTVLGADRVGASAGALVYLLTPYQLAFAGRLSALLLPWAALPWIVGLLARATRTRDWAAPAALALVVFLASGVNASSLVLVGLAPALWVLAEVLTGRGARALAGAARAAILALGVSAFWIVGLRIQGAYGLPILHLTERVPTVAAESAPGELLRGLGNWFFLISSEGRRVVPMAEDYVDRSLVIALTLALPVLALLSAILVRWRHRAYLCSLVVVGTVVGAGAWRDGDASPYASAWERFTDSNAIGLSLRNSPRVVPVIALGCAGLLAGAVSAVPRPPWRRAAGAAVAVLALAAFLPVWQEGYPGEDVARPEDLPAEWLDAAAAVDRGDHGTRVLQLPGAAFEYHRWGVTVDPLLPMLTDRPVAVRQILPGGTPASVNLLDAIDRRAQLGTLESSALAPLAHLLGVGTYVVRSDLAEGDRFQPADPRVVREALDDVVGDGLEAPSRFGPDVDGERSVSLYDVTSPGALVSTSPAFAPVVLAGDGDGIIDAAASGVLGDGRGLVRYSGDLDDAELRRALDDGAHLVVTDSNRRRAQTWFTSLRDSRGPTERAGVLEPDPTGYDFRLDLFPERGDDARTVVEQVGGEVSATSAGGALHPEDRAAHAVDGDATTAWRVGGDPTGAVLTIRPDAPIEAGEVAILQQREAAAGRRITDVMVRVDGGPAIAVTLDERSLSGSGQVVPLADDVVEELTITITGATGATDAEGGDRVGIAEVGLGDLVIDEQVRPPVDLLARAGADAAKNPLDIVLTRLRVGLGPGIRSDEEVRLRRVIELPFARTFAVRGSLSTALPGDDTSCQAGLLEIDGEPVPMRTTSPGSLDLESCGPVDLDAGRHVITGSGGRSTVDRVVLRAGVRDGADVAGRAPSTEVLDRTATSARVRIDAGDEPFWLVLGESDNDGWSAEVTAGDAQLGPRERVDGFANGWLVQPGDEETIEVELRWRPQRAAQVGYLVSIGSLAVAGFLLWRSRRRRAEPEPALAAAPQPARAWGASWSWGARVALVAAVVVATTLVAGPELALAAGGLTLVGVSIRQLALPVALIAPIALSLCRPLERPDLAWLALALASAQVAWTLDQDGSKALSADGS